MTGLRYELDEALYVSDRIIGMRPSDTGATIVYDCPSPVFRPGNPRDFNRFKAQKEEILSVVFGTDADSRHRKLIRLWEDTSDEDLPGDENLDKDRI